METATMNVLFDGEDDKDDTDDVNFEEKLDKTLRDYEDDYYRFIYNRRHTTSR